MRTLRASALRLGGCRTGPLPGARGSARVRAAALALPLLAAACAVGPAYVPPEADVPAQWPVALGPVLQEGRADLTGWWQRLGDTTLTGLVERALERNLDLRLAVSRIDESRALRGLARGDFLPSLTPNGSYQRTVVDQQITEVVVPGGGRQFDVYSLGLDGSWEVDLFGRIRRSVEAADAELEASVDDYRGVFVALVADVASAYVDVRTLQERIRLARLNVGRQAESLELTQLRNRAGLAPDLDVRQAELNLATTESFIPQLEIALANAIHRLGVLLGRTPGSLYEELAAPGPIPAPPDAVLVGFPADLVRRRPDVRAAERRIAAETARVGVATADLYPRFTLIGTFGFQSTSTQSLLTGGTFAMNAGPAFEWNVFDGGRIRARIQAQEARSDQAALAWESAVLRALEETDNALVAFERESVRRETLERSVTAADESADLVRGLYLAGLTNFLNVLDTETRLFEQQDQLAESQGLVVQNLIALFRALGGGWAS